MRIDFEALIVGIFGLIMLIGIIMNTITSDVGWLIFDLVVCGIAFVGYIIGMILKRKP